MDASSPPFAAQLRAYRVRAGLSQEELARRADLSPRAISALERGERRRAYPHTMRALATALQLSEVERAAFFAAVPRGGAPPAASAISERADQNWRLPAPPTPIVGREDEEAAILRLSDGPDTRLITLTGPGGVGKSRLALEVAAGLRRRGDRVLFVDLTPLRDPRLVPAVIAQDLGAPERGTAAALAGLLAEMGERRLVLVLDNFEHLLAAAPLAAELLAAAPALRLLVTSRTPLRIRGEHEFPVPPLPVPAPDATSPATLLASPAVRLYAARAGAIDPTFTPGPAELTSIAEICTQLDGLPLAIELAAARSRVLPPAALLARLTDRLGLLTSGAADAPVRQRTLRDAIAWSHDLLHDEERALFRRLAVFRGGFTLEAAAWMSGDHWRQDGYVAASASPPPGVAADTVEALARASLLVRQVNDAGVRFAMLQTIQDFAAERLQAAGEAPEAREAHVGFALALATACEQWLRGGEQRSWLGRLEREIDNLRAALRHLHDQGDAARGLQLAAALQWFWWDRGYLREGEQWLTDMLALPGPVASAVRAKALNGASYLSGSCGEHDAAVALATKALALDRQAGDRERIAWSLAFLAAAHYRRGEIAAARSLGEESLAIFRALGIAAGISFAIGYTGLAAQGQGDDRAARTLLEEGVTLSRELSERDNLSRALLGLGFLAHFNAGDAVTAREHFRSSLEVAAELGHPYPLSYALEGLAGVAAAEAQLERALRLAAAAAALRNLHDAVPAPQLRVRHQQMLEGVRRGLSPEAGRAAWDEGWAMTRDEAIADALEIA